MYADMKEPLNQAELFEQYDEYLDQHIGNVKKGYKWLKENIPSVTNKANENELDKIINTHDASKYTGEEYMPYAKYFYGKSKSKEVKEDFDYAWLHHIHANPHHWQYWILVNDDDGTKALDMPYEQIVAMVCDHWAFSWNKDNLYEIFNWYDAHKKKVIFSEYTKKTYENILNLIKKKLDSQEKVNDEE